VRRDLNIQQEGKILIQKRNNRWPACQAKQIISKSTEASQKAKLTI
jgi:hypothetical protein